MKTSYKNIILLVLASATWALLGASCRNTVRGAGRDVENVGDHITRAAR